MRARLAPTARRVFLAAVPLAICALRLVIPARGLDVADQRALVDAALAFLLAAWLLGFALAALGAAANVHRVRESDEVNRLGPVALRQSWEAAPRLIPLSEPEIGLPLSYFGLPGIMMGSPSPILTSGEPCQWILHGRYIGIYAAPQSVLEQGRANPPAIPHRCWPVDSWTMATRARRWT